jgi:Na+/proline symporter
VTAGTTGNIFFMGLLRSVVFTASFGEPGIPHIMVRFMSLDDPKKMKMSAVVGLTWVAVATWGAIMCGLLARAITSVSGGLADPETSVTFMASHLLNPWLEGIIIAGALSAIMSTCDAELLVASSSFLRDILNKGFNVQADDKTLVRWSRYTVLAVTLVALIMARVPGVIYFMVVFAWSGMAVCFAPLTIASLWWRDLTRQGALASICGAFLTCVIWHYSPLEKIINFQWPAMLVSIVLIVVVSKMTKVDSEVVAKYDKIVGSIHSVVPEGVKEPIR